MSLLLAFPVYGFTLPTVVYAHVCSILSVVSLDVDETTLCINQGSQQQPVQAKVGLWGLSEAVGVEKVSLKPL